MPRDAAWTREKLIAYLGSKRWFGQKGAKIRDAHIADEVEIAWRGAERPYTVARVEVETDAGSGTYQVLFDPTAPEPNDALENAEFRRALVDAFLTGATFENAGTDTRWVVESEAAQPLAVPAAAQIRLASAEQSNTSVIIDQEAILKLYRRLERGIQPDVEVTRFLTVERGFPQVPALLGTIRFEDPGGITTAGMLQELVPQAMDAWRYAIECSTPYFQGTGADSAPPFAQDAERLGDLTRRLHETLASGEPGSAFDLIPASAADVDEWAQAARGTVERACRALERAMADGRIPGAYAAEATAVCQKRPGFLQELSALASDIGDDAGAKTRTHGDYHLGQVLRSATESYLVIDFEGEPARPLHERRARQSPMRDVAGMVRSFAYAAAIGAGAQSGEGGAGRPLATTADARATRWYRSARDAFLRGYFTADGATPRLLPRSQSNAGRLLALFKMEKVFYELQYEIDHRPAWAWIPLRGIGRFGA